MFKNKHFDFSKGEKTPLKSAIVGAVGVFGALYLLNPFGISLDTAFDNFPLIGNLDETTATLLLIASLRYFGIDLIEMFTGLGSKKAKDSEIGSKDPSEPRYEAPN